MYVRTICTVFMSTQYVKHVYTQNISSVHVYTMCETYIYIQKKKKKSGTSIYTVHTVCMSITQYVKHAYKQYSVNLNILSM